MSGPLSLSIFTIEADQKPILAFAAKKYEEAETFFRDEGLRTKLRLTISGGVSLRRANHSAPSASKRNRARPLPRRNGV